MPDVLVDHRVSAPVRGSRTPAFHRPGSGKKWYGAACRESERSLSWAESRAALVVQAADPRHEEVRLTAFMMHTNTPRHQLFTAIVENIAACRVVGLATHADTARWVAPHFQKKSAAVKDSTATSQVRDDESRSPACCVGIAAVGFNDATSIKAFLDPLSPFLGQSTDEQGT